MDLDMLAHPATRHNIELLKQYGNQILEPETGELASGLTGKGRMEEAGNIVEALKKYFSRKKKIPALLKGKKILVTAGPTCEPIDPVRFISNHSSGRMGYALAEALAFHGARVILVSGPTAEKTSFPGITLIRVQTADEMYKECISQYPKMDGAILVAAVADYKPKHKAQEKIKRSSQNLTLELEENPDIAAALGNMKKKKQFLAGFALETQNPVENARTKMKKKNFNFIVLNSLENKGAGFGTDTNKITILDRHNRKIEFPLKSKQEVAEDILYYLQTIL
jgi:phosphopantothenoylcysteine decarboxylase/phosphopantothenate--cysteine ligase